MCYNYWVNQNTDFPFWKLFCKMQSWVNKSIMMTESKWILLVNPNLLFVAQEQPWVFPVPFTFLCSFCLIPLFGSPRFLWVPSVSPQFLSFCHFLHLGFSLFQSLLSFFWLANFLVPSVSDITNVSSFKLSPSSLCLILLVSSFCLTQSLSFYCLNPSLTSRLMPFFCLTFSLSPHDILSFFLSHPILMLGNFKAALYDDLALFFAVNDTGYQPYIC